MKVLMAQIEELNESFNELGEDLILLESVVIASRLGHDFPEDLVGSGIKRVTDYLHQHLRDIQDLSRIVCKNARTTNQA